MYEMRDVNTPPREDQPYGERLTVEQYEQLTPMLKLADHGKPEAERLTERMKPGEIKRRELKRRVIDALREHGTIGHAAAAAGISPATVYRWRDADPEFAAAVTDFMNVDLVDTLVQSAYKLATSEDPRLANAAVRAQEMLLKAYAPEQFTERHKIEQTVSINQTVQVIHEVRDQMRERQQEKLKQLRTVDMEAPVLPST